MPTSFGYRPLVALLVVLGALAGAELRAQAPRAGRTIRPLRRKALRPRAFAWAQKPCRRPRASPPLPDRNLAHRKSAVSQRAHRKLADRKPEDRDRPRPGQKRRRRSHRFS